MKSDRGISLILQHTPLTPTVTAEDYCKWYRLFVVHPDGSVQTVAFHDLPEVPGKGPQYCDHTPNPHAVLQYCQERDWEVDDTTFERIVGRWEVEYKENY